MIAVGDVYATEDGRDRVFVTRTTLGGRPFICYATLPYDGGEGAYGSGGDPESRFLGDYPQRLGRMRINGLYQLLRKERSGRLSATRRVADLAAENRALVDRLAWLDERIRAERESRARTDVESRVRWFRRRR